MTLEGEQKEGEGEFALDEDLIRREGLTRALLVGVFKGNENRHIAREHLEELVLLADTCGATVVGQVECGVRRFDAGTFVTQGKLEELCEKAKEVSADFVIFDEEISPAQQRNLEEAFGVTVMDRTELILEVFAQRAQTREARLQIELARVRYQFPRLKRLWTHLSRQRMTGGYLKGAGEKQLEIDKRLLQKRVDKIQKELASVGRHRDTQRGARMRSETPIFAIVGYTNAGKSTLINALTEAGVFVEDKLFATLDTTTRKFTLPNHQEILLIDTVGFIRKLPHQLVAAFKSTLEEAVHCDILLHLVDVSDPLAEEHARVTRELLEELGAKDCPILTVLNKVDVVGKGEECDAVVEQLRRTYPKTVEISALKKTGFDDLFDLMIGELSKRRRVVQLRIPQSDYAVVSELVSVGNVLEQDYEENDVLLTVDIPRTMVGRVDKYLVHGV